ncbi:MAG: DUF4388 domain-containing protein [Syntrophobacter sp.]
MQPVEQAPQGFTGTINLRLTDLIQMVCLSRSDVVIRVSSKNGKGMISIQQGQIQHAQSGELSGEEALFEVLEWSDGQFEILPFVGAETSSIDKPWEHLLLEAIRRQDESANGSCEEDDDAPKQFDIGELFDNLDACIFPENAIQEDTDPAPAETVCRATKVLIVEDSPFFSKKIREMLERDPAIEVVGVAPHGEDLLKVLNSGATVDVITLDIEMPVMPGETTIKHVMIRHRRPVVIISSLQSHSVAKVFDFLQLGAVDFMSKPQGGEDHELYAARLQEIVKGAAKAQVSNFRRLRKHNGDNRPLPTGNSRPGKQVLVIVGGEGAHVDWFRLPLQNLCGNGIVIGLQKMPDSFLPGFCRLIETKTQVGTEPLIANHDLAPARFYFGNASRVGDFKFDSDEFSLGLKITGAETMDWKSGIQFWLCSLAEQIRDSMKICFLSAADSLPDRTTTTLLASNAKVILAPPKSAVCSQMIDSIRPYADLFPEQVIFSDPETLSEYF